MTRMNHKQGRAVRGRRAFTDAEELEIYCAMSSENRTAEQEATARGVTARTIENVIARVKKRNQEEAHG